MGIIWIFILVWPAIFLIGCLQGAWRYLMNNPRCCDCGSLIDMSNVKGYTESMRETTKFSCGRH